MSDGFKPGDLGWAITEMVGGPPDGQTYGDTPMFPEGPPETIDIPLGGPDSASRAVYRRRDEPPYELPGHGLVWRYDWVAPSNAGPAQLSTQASAGSGETLSFAALADIFAIGMLHKGRSLRELPLTHGQKARLRESIGVDIRKLCDMAIPAVRRPEISVAAAAAAAALGIDLATETWQSQPRFDPGRAVFHYEHCTPVGMLVLQVIDAAHSGEIVAVLDRGLRLAWITKAEDARLTQLGFKHKRPDSDAAYAEAGIALV